MRDRIDPLIEERAPWMTSGRLHHRIARAGLERMLSYPETLRLAERVRELPTPDIMGAVAERIARRVTVEGLENLPAAGPALVVANHPTGIADGVILYHVLSQVRPDLYIFANADILRVLPQMADTIAPVEWRQEKRTHAKTRATMEYTHRAMEAGRLGLIFPSGRLAKRRGLALHERPWMASAAMIARRFAVPVVPLHIRARNSALFYLFDAIHPTLRDITLFHEMLNKDRQAFHLTLGRPIAGERLPRDAEEATAFLCRTTLMLGDGQGTEIRLLPRWRRRTPGLTA